VEGGKEEKKRKLRRSRWSEKKKKEGELYAGLRQLDDRRRCFPGKKKRSTPSSYREKKKETKGFCPPRGKMTGRRTRSGANEKSPGRRTRHRKGGERKRHTEKRRHHRSPPSARKSYGSGGLDRVGGRERKRGLLLPEEKKKKGPVQTGFFPSGPRRKGLMGGLVSRARRMEQKKGEES